MLEEIRNEETSKIIKKVICLIILDILVFSMSNKFNYNYYLPIYTGIRVGLLLISFVSTLFEFVKWMFKVIKEQAAILSDDEDFIDEEAYTSNFEKYKTMIILSCELFVLMIFLDPLLMNFREMVFKNFIFYQTLINLILYQMLFDLLRVHIYHKMNQSKAAEI